MNIFSFSSFSFLLLLDCVIEACQVNHWLTLCTTGLNVLHLSSLFFKQTADDTNGTSILDQSVIKKGRNTHSLFNTKTHISVLWAMWPYFKIYIYIYSNNWRISQVERGNTRALFSRQFIWVSSLLGYLDRFLWIIMIYCMDMCVTSGPVPREMSWSVWLWP